MSDTVQRYSDEALSAAYAAFIAEGRPATQMMGEALNAAYAIDEPAPERVLLRLQRSAFAWALVSQRVCDWPLAEQLALKQYPDPMVGSAAHQDCAICKREVAEAPF